MMRSFTVAVLGCGNRGAEAYGTLFFHSGGRFRILALCDVDPARLQKYGDRFGIAAERRFLDEEEFLREKRADLLVIATLDRDHVRQCLKALTLGYDVLLEKPISSDRAECEELLRAQRESGRQVFVCHVLRYAPAFVKAGQLLREGAIGRLIAIQALEQVAYWHQAHSYVRGNWRSREETAPMILAKCCHDLDLLQYYAASRCESLTSVGDLAYFTSENAPAGCAERCTECGLRKECPYSAERIYLDGWEKEGRPAQAWPYIQITNANPITRAALEEAIGRGPYGRCVFICDNDVVDHQLTQITFENGVKATLTMTAFTAGGGRILTFFGTSGEIVLDEARDLIEVRSFGAPVEQIRISSIGELGSGHGGGDGGLIDGLYASLCGAPCGTSLEASLESHFMAFCAEQSRLAGGALVYVHGERD